MAADRRVRRRFEWERRLRYGLARPSCRLGLGNCSVLPSRRGPARSRCPQRGLMSAWHAVCPSGQSCTSGSVPGCGRRDGRACCHTSGARRSGGGRGVVLHQRSTTRRLAGRVVGRKARPRGLSSRAGPGSDALRPRRRRHLRCGAESVPTGTVGVGRALRAFDMGVRPRHPGLVPLSHPMPREAHLGGRRGRLERLLPRAPPDERGDGDTSAARGPSREPR